MPEFNEYPLVSGPNVDKVALAAFVKKHGLPAEVPHSAYAYRVWLCRDDACKEAFAVEQFNARQIRFQKTTDNGGVAPVKKHNANTRRNWGCKCNKCGRDYRKRRREAYAEKKVA